MADNTFNNEQIIEFVYQLNLATVALVRAITVYNSGALEALIVWAMLDTSDDWTFCGSIKTQQDDPNLLIHYATNLLVDKFYA